MPQAPRLALLPERDRPLNEDYYLVRKTHFCFDWTKRHFIKSIIMALRMQHQSEEEGGGGTRAHVVDVVDVGIAEGHRRGQRIGNE